LEEEQVGKEERQMEQEAVKEERKKDSFHSTTMMKKN
jgi:hypothetical protein